MILNLKKINYFLPQSFRMETLSVVLPQLSRQDWAVTIDLQDAYLHVPIHLRSRRLLGFYLQGTCYQYQVLPFGLRDSSSGRNCLSETERNQNILLPGRLVTGGKVEDSAGVPASGYIGGDSSSGLPGKLGKVFPGSYPTSVVSRSGLGHSQLGGSSIGSQDCFTAISNS